MTVLINHISRTADLRLNIYLHTGWCISILPLDDDFAEVAVINAEGKFEFITHVPLCELWNNCSLVSDPARFEIFKQELMDELKKEKEKEEKSMGGERDEDTRVVVEILKLGSPHVLH